MTMRLMMLLYMTHDIKHVCLTVGAYRASQRAGCSKSGRAHLGYR
jgi:hypothetical protein